MTLNVDFTPQTEAWIQYQARRQGVPPEEIVRKLVDREATPSQGYEHSAVPVSRDHFYFTASTEEFNRALVEIAEMNRDVPALPEEAFGRENLYQERF